MLQLIVAQNAHLSPAPHLKEEIKDVIDHHIVSTRGGGYQKYLSNGEGEHFQITHGSQIRNSNT